MIQPIQKGLSYKNLIKWTARPLESLTTVYNKETFTVEQQLDIQDKEQQKLNNYRSFINATLEIIEEGGLSKVSIRKIADRAGFHNSRL